MDDVAEVAPPLLCMSLWCIEAKGVSEGPAELLEHL